MPALLPERRCALTAPFHPYQNKKTGGLLSVALIPKVALAGGYPAPCFREARTFLDMQVSHCITAIIQPSDCGHIMVKKYLNNILYGN